MTWEERGGFLSRGAYILKIQRFLILYTVSLPLAGEQLPYSNIKIGKSNTQTIFKIMRKCSSLNKIFETEYFNKASAYVNDMNSHLYQFFSMIAPFSFCIKVAQCPFVCLYVMVCLRKGPTDWADEMILS